MPSASAVRPGRCPSCRAASQPAGGKVVVHGDGTRERQMRGPETAAGPAVITTVRVRRYQCQSCGCCMLVVPSEILPRRLYTASAIAFALALWALVGATEAAVRARASPFRVVGAAAHGGWITLRRWATDAGRGRLFSTSRAPPSSFTLRQHAERAAAGVVALAPAGLAPDAAAFVGAARHRPRRSRSAEAVAPAIRDPAATPR